MKISKVLLRYEEHYQQTYPSNGVASLLKRNFSCKMLLKYQVFLHLFKIRRTDEG